MLMKGLALAAVSVPALVTTVHGGPRDMIRSMIVRRLELTQAQQDSIHRVMESHKASLHAKGESLFEARSAVAEAVIDPATEPETLKELEAKASAAHLAMELELNQVAREINPILTDSQRTQARELFREFRAHALTMRKWFHGGEPGGLH